MFKVSFHKCRASGRKRTSGCKSILCVYMKRRYPKPEEKRVAQSQRLYHRPEDWGVSFNDSSLFGVVRGRNEENQQL